jgi:type IV pilus assembly protein PilY1
MKSRISTVMTSVAMGLIIALLGRGEARAVVSNADYSAAPPFVSSVTAPNILLLLDNSGSMADPACDPNNCGVHSNGSTTPIVQTYVNDTKYTGFFDSLKCYTYDTAAGNTRFVEASTKALITLACPSTQWDGNLLNWSTFRRFDALKKAMSGGDCVVTRAPDGTCPAVGAPALKTITAQKNSIIPVEATSHSQYRVVPVTVIPGVFRRA